MIRSLRLINFKAFADATVPLGNLTLLSGLNSSGKSTVLQSLGLLRQALDAHTGVADTDQSAAPGLPLAGEYVQLGIGRDVLHEDYTTKKRLIGFELTLGNGQVATATAAYEAEDDVLPLLEAPFASAAWQDPGLSLTQPGFQYLRADRITPATTYDRSYEMSVRREFLGTRGEYTIDYLRQHQDHPVAEHLRHPESQSPRLLAQADAWLSEICPGVRLSTEAVENTDLVRLGVQFSSPGKTVSAERRPTNVGFGITYVLPIIVACLTAHDGALILLENPEAHIHPRGQSAMARLACSAARHAQVIVESHSDHVLNGVRLEVKRGVIAGDDARLHYFSRPDGGGPVRVASPAIGPDGMLSEWPEGFFDEWDATIDKLLS